MSSLEIGDTAVLRSEFRDNSNPAASSKPLIDPTAVYFLVKVPEGTETVYQYSVDAAVIKDAVGQYHLDLPLTSSGRYYFRAVGTGANSGADENNFVVRDTVFSAPLPP